VILTANDISVGLYTVDGLCCVLCEVRTEFSASFISTSGSEDFANGGGGGRKIPQCYMRDQQVTMGGRPKVVLSVDLKIPTPYKMIMSERGLRNVGNQGVMAPRISREVTFVYVCFCFLPLTTNNFNTNTFKTTFKRILYGQNDNT